MPTLSSQVINWTYKSIFFFFVKLKMVFRVIFLYILDKILKLFFNNLKTQ